jgi:hypothetical protein
MNGARYRGAQSARRGAKRGQFEPFGRAKRKLQLATYTIFDCVFEVLAERSQIHEWNQWQTTTLD